MTERSNYYATVAIAFPAPATKNAKEFDLYEINVLFESDGPDQALDDAIAFSKQTQAALHSQPAVLHAVRHIQPVQLGLGWQVPQDWPPVKVGTVHWRSLEALRSGDKVGIWYRLIHVDGAGPN